MRSLFLLPRRSNPDYLSEAALPSVPKPVRTLTSLAIVILASAARVALAQDSPTSIDVHAPAVRHPAKEDTYTITSVIQVLNPVRPTDMVDDFQDVRVVAQDNDSTTLEVRYYPLYVPPIGENPNWRRDYAGMTEYLKPGPAANWDVQMQQDLLAELRGAAINPDKLTDRELVRQVSRWAMKRATAIETFAIWCVYFPGVMPAVYPALRQAFDHQRPDASWSDRQMFDQELLGRSLFYNKVHGSCTSTAVYLSTIFRALGIPTRLVFCIPPFDPNDKTQADKFYAAIHHHSTRETVRTALDGMTGFDNHVFNEVYIDHRWVRLNYSTVGQPILDARYFGLLTHIYTCSDLSDVPLAATWGMRFFTYPKNQPKFSSINPYRLISVEDHFGANAALDNPMMERAGELRTVTIIGLYQEDSPSIPAWVDRSAWKRSKTDFLIAFREWIPGRNHVQMREFESKASHDFVLTAPNHVDVRVKLTGMKLSAGDGSFQTFGGQIVPADRAKLERGIAYNLHPANTSDTYRWQVADNLAPLWWEAQAP
jgi:Transglutaminase-like superfamily